jgi:predicted dithiol-disulfide oxidoreductase (DUF899 family)
MANDDSGPIIDHSVTTRDAWLKARVELLDKEKNFSRLRDELNEQRRALPWVRLEKKYVFQTPTGQASLADLFDGKRQLIVYHFMFSPEQAEGCPHCSFWAEHFDGTRAHIGQRDTTFSAVSRAPIEKLEAFKRRMGWEFRWVSSDDGDFNYDFGVSFRPAEQRKASGVYNYRPGESGADREGVSVFYRGEDGAIYHTYSTYARGIDLLNTTYNYLDLTPKGRDEASSPQAWVRHKDKYALGQS